MPYVLEAAEFAGYPVQARELATKHLPLLRRVPPVFAALLLREMVGYDWRFPAERADIERQLSFLEGLDEAGLRETMKGFAGLSLSAALADERWAAGPGEFVEKLTAYMWTVHEMDRFREVAGAYQEALLAAEPEPGPAIPRLCCVVVGKGAVPGVVKLFGRLRAHGTYFSRVKAAGGLDEMFRTLGERVRAHPAAHGHWYVDGGEPFPAAAGAGLATVSYARLAPLRRALLEKMKTARNVGDVVGPESLRSLLASLRPEQMTAAGTAADPVQAHFELSLLTEGSGTQIFSTTFVQWAGRELLRRARPLTLVLRYAPRQVDRPMNELLLADAPGKVQEDPAGSLVDADMGAFYTWVNLMRLPGAEQASFAVWFEDQGEALAVGPGMARGTSSEAVCDLGQILRWVS